MVWLFSWIKILNFLFYYEIIIEGLKVLDHVVYVDFKDKELEKLLNHSKSMVIRGATGRKIPYGKVNQGDTLFFINNNGEGKLKAKAKVATVFNSEKMDESASSKLVHDNMDKLQLSDKLLKKWSGKRYLVLIEVDNITEINPFKIDKSNFGNMDDWLPVGDIENVKI